MSDTKKRRISQDESYPNNYESTLKTMLLPLEKEDLRDILIKIGSKDDSIFQDIKSYAGKNENTRKLFVHNIPHDATKESFESVFSQFGSIQECNLVRDKTTNALKGYAFVTYRDCESAVNACNSNIRIGVCSLSLFLIS